MISAAVIVLVIRTRKSLFQSLPGKYLLTATLLVVAATTILPYTPLGEVFGFQPLALEFLALIGAILILDISGAELAQGGYLDKRENLILMGNSGTGKTHLATALGLIACQ